MVFLPRRVGQLRLFHNLVFRQGIEVYSMFAAICANEFSYIQRTARMEHFVLIAWAVVIFICFVHIFNAIVVLGHHETLYSDVYSG